MVDDGPELLAVYGSLRTGLASPHLTPVIDNGLRPVGPCTLEGQLYDLGEYPGLVAGDQAVVGELFEVLDPRTLVLLDGYERYDPADLSGSLFVRLLVRLRHPEATDAWVYLYNQPLVGAALVPGGDWVAHLEQARRPLSS